MTSSSKPVVLLMADDDPEDREFAGEAFEEDIARSYDTGASSYVREPVTFEGLVEAVRTMGRYWFKIVELPRDEGSAR